VSRTGKWRRALGATAALAVTAFLAAELIAVRPLRREVGDLQRQVDERRQRLQAAGWPLDLARLEPAAADGEHRRAVAERTRDEVLTLAVSLFNARVQRQYESNEHFRRQVTRLDYQEEFNRLERKLGEAGVTLERDILKMSEDTAGADTYQLVLQVWTVEAVVDRALAAGLRVTPAVEGAGTGRRRGAMLGVLEPTFYRLDDADTEPYLMQMPVRIRVAGSVEQTQAFLRAAGAPGGFLSVDRMELRKSLPAEGGAAGHEAEADLVCSSFFLLRDDLTPRPAAAHPRVLPRGG